MSASLVTPRPDLQGPVFRPDNPGFQKDFDSKPFEFHHRFDGSHPLFQLDRLRHLLTDPRTRGGVYYDAGEIRVDQRWDSVPEKTKPVEEVFDLIDHSGAWIILRRIHKDPEYNAILEDCLDEVKRLSGRSIDQDQKSQEAMIFLTSPLRVTSYHLDRECNFLMQVPGRETDQRFRPRRSRGGAGRGTGNLLVQGQQRRHLQTTVSGPCIRLYHAAGYRRAYPGELSALVEKRK